MERARAEKRGAKGGRRASRTECEMADLRGDVWEDLVFFSSFIVGVSGVINQRERRICREWERV